MLNFKTIRWRNFLSTGNQFNEIRLDTGKQTLIVGGNGNGKSSVLCALTFALFGKPFRNISKGGLVNSINQKNCVVEIEFEEGGANYKVIRGIKPNIFEIYRNEELINQDSAVKDYQVVLEQQILKMNMKTFTQVVILGSATFTPFMKMGSSQRREIIEDILDIRIFSIMNQLLKERLSKTKEELTYIESALKIAKNKVESQQRIIAHLEVNKQAEVDSIKANIAEDTSTVENRQAKIAAAQDIVDKLTPSVLEKDAVNAKLKSLNNIMRKVKHEIDTLDKSIVFFNENASCPSCQQNIPHTHSGGVLSDLESSKKDMNDLFIQSGTEYKEQEKRLSDITETEQHIVSAKNDIRGLQSEINVIQNRLTKLNQTLVESVSSTQNIEAEKNTLKDLVEEAIRLINRKKILVEQKGVEDVGVLLLKDGGIKTAIIREYLPLMNTLINKYLAVMDFYCDFNLDEQFNEVIKSRYRDTMTYDNFSEGEKSRIDLALLFAWREVAKLKNSANTNLLILDEIFSGSLDGEGSTSLIGVLKSQIGISVFIISHDEQVKDMFDDVLQVEKQNDFSVIIHNK